LLQRWARRTGLPSPQAFTARGTTATASLLITKHRGIRYGSQLFGWLPAWLPTGNTWRSSKRAVTSGPRFGWPTAGRLVRAALAGAALLGTATAILVADDPGRHAARQRGRTRLPR